MTNLVSAQCSRANEEVSAQFERMRIARLEGKLVRVLIEIQESNRSKRPPMTLDLTFSFLLQVVAAVAFVSVYLALLVSLIICLFIAKGIYHGAKRVLAH